MCNKRYLGVDVGAHGAIAVLDAKGGLIDVYDMPVIQMKVGKSMRDRVAAHGLAAMVRDLQVAMVFLERVGGMTGQSASAAFTFGHGAGLVEGVLVGLDVPLSYVTPQRWKKGFALSADKGAARQKAMQIWPEKAKKFARVKDDGRAEAALIARFGMQQVH